MHQHFSTHSTEVWDYIYNGTILYTKTASKEFGHVELQILKATKTYTILVCPKPAKWKNKTVTNSKHFSDSSSKVYM